MSRIKFTLLTGIFFALFMWLCIPPGIAYAQGGSTWPVVVDLMTPDLEADTPDAWRPVGAVSFKNSNSNYIVEVFPDPPYRIADVAIHVVEDPEEFESLLDKKGKPKTNAFDYKTDFLDGDGIPSDYHYQLVPLDNFSTECFAPNLKACPGLYTVVVVSLVEPQGSKWKALPESAYAEESGTFANLAKLDERVWSWYVTYQRARPMAGHFVDANVNGLTYETISQYGVTEFSTDTGTTGQGGQFWFLPEERIKFSVGDLFLGETLADRILAPTDMFDGGDLDDDRVINMARLLQSLDDDGVNTQGAINISEPAVACLNSALGTLYSGSIPSPEALFSDDEAVGALIAKTVGDCSAAELKAVTREEALENLNFGMQAGNLMKRNISKTPGLKSDKAKIEIAPVYVPAQRPDGTATTVVYHDEDGNVIEPRTIAKPIIVAYEDEVEGTGTADVFVAISRDDGDSWKRRNVSKTADKSSLIGYPGKSQKPMLKVKDNLVFVAWVDKYCRGGRPGYAINVCPDTNGDGAADPCDFCRDLRDDEGNLVLDADGNVEQQCTTDYPGDDAYWQDDLFGVAGPQRSVIYEDEPGVGEVPYSCVWTARAVIDVDTGDIQWFKPERVTSGRRDAYQLFAGAGDDVAFAIVWQEDPKGLMAGEGDGPGDGWSGANTHSKTDIWYSYIRMDEFGLVDSDYPSGDFKDGDLVDTDPELAGRVKALVPMSLPVKISDNDMCSEENIAGVGGGEHDLDEEGEGTHRYCAAVGVIGTEESPGTNPLCQYTIEKANPKGEIHHVCVTADERLLDGNTGASRANIFLQPYCKEFNESNKCVAKSAWVIIGYEESKGVGSPPEEEEGCGDEEVAVSDDEIVRYKPDMGKNVIYHSFDFEAPEFVSGGGILNLPETDANGDLVYLYEGDELGNVKLDEYGEPVLLLDWKGEPQLAYENARRIRFLTQSPSKKGDSGTVLVALYRQGAEGSGKPADIFMRRVVAKKGNPFAFENFTKGAQNVSSVEPTTLWQNPADPGAPVKMLRWSWSPANLADSSSKNPYTDARAHRGALNGDELIIGYTLTPNWGRNANDKYDFYVRRSFNGGQAWTTDPDENAPATTHNVVFREPVLDPDTKLPLVDEETGHLLWEEVVETTTYAAGASEPPRNVSNLRNYRTSVLEPRLVKTPGTIVPTLYAEDVQDTSIYQVAWGLEFNQNAEPNDAVFPKQPLDIYYGRTMDTGQAYETVIVTPQGGNGQPEESWNSLAKDHPEQGAAQLRQTPDGSRMYGIWLEEERDAQGNITASDIMFRRVDYR